MSCMRAKNETDFFAGKYFGSKLAGDDSSFLFGQYPKFSSMHNYWAT